MGPDRLLRFHRAHLHAGARASSTASSGCGATRSAWKFPHRSFARTLRVFHAPDRHHFKRHRSSEWQRACTSSVRMVAVVGGRERSGAHVSGAAMRGLRHRARTAARWRSLRRVLARRRPHHAAVVRRLRRCAASRRRHGSHARNPVSSICARCANPPRFTMARSAGRYDGPLRNVIHVFKYGRRRPLAAPLARLMTAAAAEVLAGADAVVPVPLHPWRALRRGFNQADDLAVHLGLPVWRVLRRTRHGPRQASLPAGQRGSNVVGAFRFEADVRTVESVAGTAAPRSNRRARGRRDDDWRDAGCLQRSAAGGRCQDRSGADSRANRGNTACSTASPTSSRDCSALMTAQP